MDAQCMACNFRRSVETARKLGDDHTATAFARALMELYLATPEGRSTPTLTPKINDLFVKFYHLDPDRFRQEKEDSNRFVLARLGSIRQKAETAPDPVFAGLQLAVLGNYIDFAALQEEVSFEKLDKMLDSALEMPLDTDVYAALCRDLARGKRLLYLTDNAGEIGFDRVLAEQLRRAYPHLEITFCVRGGPAQNDATRADAAAVGLDFPVIDNGTCIPGTDIASLGEEAKAAMDAADVILSKGQGNVETLLGCGYNIYYAFLIKCPKFEERFGRPKLTPMLLREK